MSEPKGHEIDEHETSPANAELEELTVDRDAILARRAIFMAAALGGLLGAAPAHADEQVAAESCPPRLTLDAETKRVASDLVARGQAAFELGDFDDAIVSFQRAFDLTQNPATALQLANALEQRGRLIDAHRLLARLHQCPDERVDAEAVRVSLLRVEEKTGVVVVLVSGPPGVLELDGAVVGRTPGSIELRALPGPHDLRVIPDDGASGLVVQRVEVRVGERIELDLRGREAPPPQPCLSIAPPPTFDEDRYNGLIEDRFRMGVSLAPVVSVQISEPSAVGAGAGIAGVIDGGLAEVLSLRGTAFAVPGYAPRGAIVQLGAMAQLVIAYTDSFGVGVGASSGYIYASGDDSSADDVPISTPFFSPELSPLFIGDNELNMEVRVSLPIGLREDDAGTESVGPLFVMSGLWMTFVDSL